ncbi:hypothetical protein [Prosthecodimorpha staleyi]|uniref:Uncharacterized protein n=1 Tax=Prosthecodimorpha staleyi TaxID=2840188 RepID=A0A947D9N8_9HYPH|nr:hypothetical protein [Prosthecodimorpha staleyi]MBT9293108.1 hypothetical protein [Prosthecodimorpha staleyi]
MINPSIYAGNFAVAEGLHLLAEWVKVVTFGTHSEWIFAAAETAGHALLWFITLGILWSTLPKIAKLLNQIGGAVFAFHTKSNMRAAALKQRLKRQICELLRKVINHVGG